MRKQTYLRRLRKSLRGVPAREKESLIEYYSELIDDAFERGKTSREVFRELEDPQIVAENYKRENAFKNDRASARDDDLDERLERLERLEREERISRLERLERERARNRSGDFYSDYGEPPRKERKEKRSHGLLYWLIVAPIRLILAIVGFALGLAVLIVGLAVVLAVIAVDLALLFGGIYAIVISFHMFTVNLSIALTQVGAGILLIGVHALFNFLVPPVCRGYAGLVGWLFRGFHRSDREREPRRSVSGRIASVACGLALLIIGGIVGTVGFGRLGYDYRQLAVYDDYAQTVAEYDLDAAGEIKVNCAELSLTVSPAQTDKIIVTYYTAEDNPKTLTEEEGTLILSGGAHGKEGVKQYFKNAWNRGIAFSSLAHLYNRATIEVPESFAGNLDLAVDNGPVVLAGITAEQVKVNTQNSLLKIESCTFGVLNAETTNGMITAEKLSAREAKFKTANGYVSVEDSSCSTLTAVVANGAIDLENSTAQSAELSAHNGAIELEKFAVGDVNLQTHNGAIQGSIKGKLEDYRIMASTNNGSCNLTNKDTGTYLLTAHTQNGKISLGFEE